MEILKKISQWKPEQISFLQDLVRTNSANPFVGRPEESNPDEPVEREVAEKIFSRLEEFGLSPKMIGHPNRPNVVCSIGKGKKTLIFNGHMDTVLPSDDWDFKPFSGVIRNGRLYGVGSHDMKGSLAAFIYALRALAEIEDELDGEVIAEFVVDEEPVANSEFGTKLLIRKGIGGDAAIVGEPGTKKISIGNRGGFRFKITTFGRSVHTGLREWQRGEGGKNAILEMAEAIERLKGFEFPISSHPLFPGWGNVFTFPTIIRGGKSINMVPDKCEAWGDVRMLPGVTEKDIMEEIERRLEGLKYEIDVLTYVPACVISPEERIVKAMLKASKEVLNKEPRIEGAGPWSDLWMFISSGIPAINFGPDGSGGHMRNEYVLVDSVVEVTKAYAYAAVEFFSEED